MLQKGGSQVATVEPHLSEPPLSIPSIIQNNGRKFLKQVMAKC